MAKLKSGSMGGDPIYFFWCPGCRETHTFVVAKGEWSFNGDMDKPTFRPSLKYDDCHLVLKDGIIQFCHDCEHPYRDKDVPLVEF